MYRYKTYGLNIQSILALPELVTKEETLDFNQDQVDVTICFGKVDNLPDALVNKSHFIWPAPEGIYLGWKDIGVFLIKDGGRVIIDPIPSVQEPVLRLFILGSTLAMILHQRREMAVIHASVVMVGSQALAFVGNKGAGKSTMAATLLARGHQLLSDDILAVDLGKPKPLAQPGYSQLKLYPDTLKSLGYEPQRFPRLRPGMEKRGHRLNVDFPEIPMPLGGIFVLDIGNESTIESLRSWAALNTLIPHWYAARFGTEVMRALGMPNHFLQCAELAKRVPVCLLKRPNELAALPETAQLIESWSTEHET